MPTAFFVKYKLTKKGEFYRMDQHQRILRRIIELKQDDEIWREIAVAIEEEFGEPFTPDKARSRWRRRDKNRTGKKSTSEENTAEDYEDLILSDLSEGDYSTVDEFLKRKGANLEDFAIVDVTLNEYAGNEQTKVRLKPKTPDKFNQEDFLKRIEETVGRFVSTESKKTKSGDVQDGRKESLFIPCLFDAHIDSPSFSGDYVNWVRELLQMGINSGYSPDRILFIVGNDFGHIDNSRYETTKGTMVGATRTYLDSVDERCTVILEACALLREFTSHLDIAFVPGNHDAFSTYWLGKVVGSFFRSDGGISILNEQNPRKYYLYGDNLFGLTHGSDEKRMDLAALMAVEAPLLWAKSKNRLWLTGHLHQKQRAYSMLSEKFGVIQRIFPSLVAPDDWHILKGYVGNERAAEMLVYGAEGKLAEFHLSI